MYLFGGDYNPEQWSDQVRAEDLALMRAAGVNLVTVGVFAWSRLEPEPGRYHLGWLDRVLDDLHAAGVGVALATPSASPPPWFTVAHPDALAQRRDGVRLVHGSRDTYCVNAPAYRQASEAIAQQLARRYAGHPAVRLWHVHNEYGTWCFCDHCAEAFRGWLRERHGGLDALNDAWTTAFWSQEYTDWAQVLPPRATQYLGNPAHELDYRRFVSDSMLTAYTRQRDLIKAEAPDAVVTTNFVLGGWVPVDHARWAAEVDLVAIDHYPSGLDTAVAESAWAADLARGWSRAAGHGGRWLLMEHAPAHVTEGGVQRRKPPGLLERLALGHIARGSAGALYFQWRASAGGAEQWHTALVGHGGPDSRIFREAAALGAVLAALPEPAAQAGPQAEVAVWFDEQCWWAVQAAHLPAPVDYEAAVRRCHDLLRRRGYAVDVVPPGADLSGYRVLVVPAAYLVDDASAAKLARFAHEGGQLLVTYLSGLVDANAGVRLGGYPGALRELLGLVVEEFDPLPPGRLQVLNAAWSEAAVARGWTEWLSAPGAEVTARYPDGRPAATSRATGTGSARYLSCELDDAGLADWLGAACADAGVPPVVPGLPDGVEAVRADGLLWVFDAAGLLLVVDELRVLRGELAECVVLGRLEHLQGELVQALEALPVDLETVVRAAVGLQQHQVGSGQVLHGEQEVDQGDAPQ
ncbi:beta-galactosidase [Catellatospora sp. TT07R-123]|uniref:beta-galactosidase n=1 Tax=Catellatospora sp. TT07R-123 TaxID=2733863 RepID=UPI001B0E624D|nr:beta-galactosidase [Catellatospora sp. TT07R-123]GHJ50146.1 beta-galactosidase [Catellatospora sp. TT07R-123]